MADKSGISRFIWMIGRILYRLEVRDIENIPAEGGCVIAWNHVAMSLDGYTIQAFKERRPDCITIGGSRVVAMQRRREAKKQIEGAESPTVAAYKARGLSAGELLKTLKFLKEGRAIALAPEGEMTWDGRLQHPLTPGAAWMALRGHVPVVPLVQFGGYDIHPRWKTTPYLTGRVTIRAGKPFYVQDAPTKQMTDEVISVASQRIYDEMAAVLALGHE